MLTNIVSEIDVCFQCLIGLNIVDIFLHDIQDCLVELLRHEIPDCKIVNNLQQIAILAGLYLQFVYPLNCFNFHYFVNLAFALVVCSIYLVVKFLQDSE